MDKRIATLTLHHAADLSPKGRHDIAEWLRKQATLVETQADHLSPRFTARYLAR